GAGCGGRWSCVAPSVPTTTSVTPGTAATRIAVSRSPADTSTAACWAISTTRLGVVSPNGWTVTLAKAPFEVVLARPSTRSETGAQSEDEAAPVHVKVIFTGAALVSPDANVPAPLVAFAEMDGPRFILRAIGTRSS